jgi:hypothetical protein
MSLCENEKNQKGGRTKKTPSYPCISKGGTKKPQKTSCHNAKIKKSKRGMDRKKTPSYPCMKMKISKRGTEKKRGKKINLFPNIMNSPTLFIIRIPLAGSPKTEDKKQGKDGCRPSRPQCPSRECTLMNLVRAVKTFGAGDRPREGHRSDIGGLSTGSSLISSWRGT